jgi:PIN domain
MPKIISPNYIDKATAISKIDTEKKPVIFWDTCSLLDIVRLPLPDRKQNVATLQNLLEIKDKIVSGDIISLSSKLCVDEFNNHIERWVNDVKTASIKLSQTLNDFVSFINKVNPTGTPIPTTNLSVYKIEDLLSQIAHVIIDNTFFINEDTTFAAFAHTRTTLKVPPAKKKGEYKDCYIWGTCLELRSTSVDKTYSYNFMSSNTTDYADTNKRDFVTEIKNEADLNGIEYFSNFNIAYGRLKTKGII